MQALLKILADGRFHSGESLGAYLGVTRSAVWKQLQQLQAQYGLEIHKVRGRGYRLPSALSLLDAEKLSASLGSLGLAVEVHEQIDSTNARLLQCVAQHASFPRVVTAEYQTAGRGRRGRQWVSPVGQNLYFSLGIRIDEGMRRIEGLSLVAGLAVLACLRTHGAPAAGLKWPNDVLVGRQKLAGILVELVGDPADICHAVIGIGVNVNMSAAEVGQPWTSLYRESGVLQDRTALAIDLAGWLMHYIERHRLEGFGALRTEWEQAHAWQQREVALSLGSQSVEGIVLGIDTHGALRLEVAGQERVFSGGELSLRLRDDS